MKAVVFIEYTGGSGEMRQSSFLYDTTSLEDLESGIMKTIEDTDPDDFVKFVDGDKSKIVSILRDCIVAVDVHKSRDVV